MSRLGIELTTAEYEAHLARMHDGWTPIDGATLTVQALPNSAFAHPIASRVVNAPRFGLAPNGRPYKSKWELEYAGWLDTQQRVERIRAWQYEALTLLIGIGVRYTPDFLIIPNPGRDAMAPKGILVPKPQVHEIKGYWRDDAKAKFRIAAMAYPWLTFHAITKRNGRWAIVETH